MKRGEHLAIPEMPWRSLAACKGASPDLFFPDSSNYVHPEAALLCSQCPVRPECLQHALTYEAHGTWAGMSAWQLRMMRRRRRAA